MSCELYTGTPGSGKSCNAARRIITTLRYGHTVICNFPINLDAVKGNHKGNFVYISTFKMRPQDLIKYAKEHFRKGKENQGLLVIDECQLVFNPKMNNKERMQWTDFFMTHRHYGWNVLLITPSHILIDRQIQAVIETEYKHRAMSNYGTFGWLFALVFGKWFWVNQVWFGCKMSLGSNVFMYRKKYGNLYDSYREFREDEKDVGDHKEDKVQKNDASNKIVTDYITMLCASSGHDGNDHSAGQG